MLCVSFHERKIQNGPPRLHAMNFKCSVFVVKQCIMGHFHYSIIYDNYQNPLAFCFLMLIRAIEYLVKHHGDYTI